MKTFMIYTDWENRLGFIENKHDWKVGEFTYVSDKKDPKKGNRVMVYANLNLDEIGEEVIKYVFKDYKRKIAFPKPNKIYKHLNFLVETVYSVIEEVKNKNLSLN